MKLSYEDVKDIFLLIIKNTWLLIKKSLVSFRQIIILISSVIILLILIFYVINFFIITIGNIAATSGLYKFSKTHFDSLYQILQYFPRYEIDIVYMAGIIAILLLWLLLLGIFKAEGGIVILPFQIDPGNKKYDGNVIAEMLIAELKRIIRIHSLDNEKKRDSEMTENNLITAYPTENIKKIAHFLELDPKGENIDKSIKAIGTLGLGSTSIPIGDMLILLRNICPGADSGVIISGCLHKSGSDICLASYMKKKNRSWRIQKEIKNAEKISNEELSVLVRELAYNIYYDLLKLQSKQNPTDVRKRLLKLRNPSGKAPDHELPNWEVLKYYTEGRDALQTYNITKERKYLNLARCYGLKAASVDPYYNNPLYLLYNVGIAYINNFSNPDYHKAERIARYIVALRPDSPRVWYSWGVALSFFWLLIRKRYIVLKMHYSLIIMRQKKVIKSQKIFIS